MTRRRRSCASGSWLPTGRCSGPRRRDESPKIAAARAALDGVDATDAVLASFAARADEDVARDAPFAWDAWRTPLERAFADDASHALDARRVRATWDEWRSALVARAYAAGEGAPAPVVEHFVARWAREAARRLPGIGGASEGYTDAIDPGDEAMQLLLELPDSALLGWSWGDADALVVAIPTEALRRGELPRAITAVTNGGR